MNNFFSKTSFAASKLICGVMLCLFVATTAFAQGHDKVLKRPSDVANDGKNDKNDKNDKKDDDKNKKKDKDDKNAAEPFNRWYYGGNVGFNFIQGGFAANISPLVGYRITPKFSVGGGVIGVGVSQTVRSNTATVPAFFGQYGGRAFTRYELFQGIFAHGEFEQAFNSVPYAITADNKVLYTVTPIPSALAGLGLNLGTGGVRLNIMALYNFLYDGYTPTQAASNLSNFNDYRFGPLVLRGGIGFGF